jgi:hypothetical protein
MRAGAPLHARTIECAPERLFMKPASSAIVLSAFQLAIAPALAADDLSVERMATCQDSWLDWKNNDSAQLKKFGDHLRSDFSAEGNNGSLVPKTHTSIAGLGVVQVFPESVGMGVGFSTVVEATFDTTRRRLETILGKPLAKCDASDNMRTCEREIREKRTFMLMAQENAKTATALLGCYYYYEK